MSSERLANQNKWIAVFAGVLILPILGILYYLEVDDFLILCFTGVLLALVAVWTKQRFWYGIVYSFLFFILLWALIPAIQGDPLYAFTHIIDEDEGLSWVLIMGTVSAVAYIVSYFLLRLMLLSYRKLKN